MSEDDEGRERPLFIAAPALDESNIPPRSKQIRIHCNICTRQTNHKVLSTADNWDDDRLLNRFEMLKCRGCGNVAFRHRVYLSAADEDIIDQQFPPATSRRMPEWINRSGLDN